MPPRTQVDFWFDPACPWAWLTSRWLLEAATVRDLDPRWHVMSLYLLNEGRDLPAAYQDTMGASRGPVRVLAAAHAGHGDEALLPLYTALGSRIHPQKLGLGRDVVEAALADVGLPAGLVEAMTSEDYDDALRASHDDGMSRVGTDVGTPVISFDGHAIFGPVVTPVPKGEAAGQLWDGVALVMGTQGFYELKRGRDQPPIFD